MKKILSWSILIIILIAAGIVATKFGQQYFNPRDLISPFVNQTKNQEPPLQKYSINRLKNFTYQASPITIFQYYDQGDQTASYLFKFESQLNTISGVLTIPDPLPSGSALPVILLIRGYVPLEKFTPGMGSRGMAQALAKAGYITLAPDFLGYGNSDPEPTDTWLARFIKPVQVIDLIASLIQQPQLTLDLKEKQLNFKIDPDRLGIWAHSNGGQIALTVLEILSQPIPTSLWAPVTAPFPYSILFFSDELADEGKETRQYISQFEEKYDVFDFSLTQHLANLTGPLQIHHGEADEAALSTWTREFEVKINQENRIRLATATSGASQITVTPATFEAKLSTNLISPNLPTTPIEITSFFYPGADHNLQPANHWQQAAQRDVKFFSQHLSP